MPRPRTAVRYHVPRDRSPVPPLVVGALVVTTLVGAQLSLAAEPPRPAPTSSAAAVASGPTTEPGPAPGPEVSGSPTAAEAGSGDASASTAGEAGGLPDPVEVTFDVGADAPSRDAEALLAPVVEALLADPTTRVRLVGHAEPSNDPVLEEQLSLSRAQAVLELLAGRGVPPDRADLVGVGATETGRSPSGTDRRVTVRVVGG